MKDEIKEINIKMPCQILDYVDTKEHLLDLFNYITNLQEKVEQYENPDDLTLFYMWLDEKAKDKMKHLQEVICELQVERYKKGKEIDRLNNIISETLKDIQHELSHLKANDEVSWNKEFYTNDKLDYKKLCIALLEQFVESLKEKE